MLSPRQCLDTAGPLLPGSRCQKQKQTGPWVSSLTAARVLRVVVEVSDRSCVRARTLTALRVRVCTSIIQDDGGDDAASFDSGARKFATPPNAPKPSLSLLPPTDANGAFLLAGCSPERCLDQTTRINGTRRLSLRKKTALVSPFFCRPCRCLLVCFSTLVLAL